MYGIINYNKIKGIRIVKSKVGKKNFNEYRKSRFNKYLLTSGVS